MSPESSTTPSSPREIEPLLRPLADYWVVLGPAPATLGPVAYCLGLLNLVRGQLDTAERDFQLALEKARLMRAAPYEAHSLFGLSEVLRRRDAPGDSERAGELLRGSALAIAEKLEMRRLLRDASAVVEQRLPQASDRQPAARVLDGERAERRLVQPGLAQCGQEALGQVRVAAASAAAQLRHLTHVLREQDLLREARVDQVEREPQHARLVVAELQADVVERDVPAPVRDLQAIPEARKGVAVTHGWATSQGVAPSVAQRQLRDTSPGARRTRNPRSSRAFRE